MNVIKSDERLQYIDIARGIAIICVILGHLGNPLITRVVFTFHVPLFFFITGYFTSSKRSVCDFIKNKARTLIVPYMITCMVIILIGTLEGFVLGDALGALKRWSYASVYGAGDSYTEPFYIPGIGAIWFLWATFWGSIFLRISLNFNKYIRLLFVAVMFATGYFSTNLFWFPLSIQAGACAFLFMYTGYLLHEIRSKMGIPVKAEIVGIIPALVIWFFFIRDFQSFWLVHCDFGRGVWDVFGCMCACAVVVLISKHVISKVKVLANFLAYFGKHSILILCVHIVELNLFPWWQITGKLIEMGMPGKYQLFLVIIGKLIADLGIGYLLSRITFVRKIMMGM